MNRGFAASEFRARVKLAQTRMEAAGLGALLLTSEPEIRYFTGFLTRFWESPSRPWFLVLPANGAPIAVIPSIGAALMAQTWISDIRVWPAPDPEDDGITLLAATLREVGGPIGVPSGPESYLRMPLASFGQVKALSALEFTHDHGIVAALRAVKSEAEIIKIAHACAIAGRAFDRVPEIAGEGALLSAVFRDFQRLLLEEGADLVAYVAGGAGPDGYGDVISPASDAPLARGDVLMLDTGAVWDGYFCDFDRNYAVGAASGNAALAHAQLAEAVEAGLEAARPGARACDVYATMAAITGAGEGSGRLGHGLGMQLTEGLSLIPQDRTELVPGMVITLEPGVTTGPGTIMVAEENIVIRAGAAERLTRFAGPVLPII
ncbi:Xaa-Pro peptidase family protein [Roseovarius sp. Pro17]|uniref:M24 family metallopeptidase n=1 Tax=Roseovarius sp. Pro17 TaxID=3108175 RepID=UPI002D777E32|nr:Xaa-Pro peptidase family protein [Roseovarius sp. Pro17]